MEQKRFTKQQDWEDYWEKLELPAEVKKSKDNLYRNIILETFDRFLTQDSELTILEIGGAPGRYLAYFAKKFHYNINALDYSEIGCRKTQDNFKLLNLEVSVYQKDLFADDISDMPEFDIVYSIGFIEHFADLKIVVEKHLQLLKPGGILFIGAPNFLGINHWVQKTLAPQNLAQHNIATMDIEKWNDYEKCFKLDTIFKGYIGGFEPGLFHRCEKQTLFNRLVFYFFRGIKYIITDRFEFLRKFNSKFWSGFVVGIYRKTE